MAEKSYLYKAIEHLLTGATSSLCALLNSIFTAIGPSDFEPPFMAAACNSFSLTAWILLCLHFFTFSSITPQAEARAFFVFGDSLVDNGNNNYLVTSARADSPPYGIDYPTRRPTGRFSNGLNIPDLIGEQMGLEPTLPYLSTLLNGENLLAGANFASAGVGILNDTGIQFLNIIRIGIQLNYFQQYQSRVSGQIGAEQTQRLVNDALVLISLGGNDFVNNYYLVPYSARSRQFALPDFVNYLIVEYRKILQNLYDLGARRVLVMGTGPMGCVPAELAQRSRNGECAEELQRAAAMYNPQLTAMLSSLNSDLGANVFIAANTFEMHMNFISDPQTYDWPSVAHRPIPRWAGSRGAGMGICTSGQSSKPSTASRTGLFLDCPATTTN
ncbi:unnamed protein product [Fraxinus pennsylvanica]|uniref:GDSL esterase/lipase n=1 Tax=Fraxinus pennsylvanica TaxID=56036 RepID=A0AAD1ZQR4_9LAMI|nr:unnamed protein product [Fraxinus pennsylvanica]